MTAASRSGPTERVEDPVASASFETFKSKVPPAGWSPNTVLPVDVNGREVLLDSYAYQGTKEHEQVLILIHTNVDMPDSVIPIVRVHSGCVTGDVFRSLRCDCYQQLQLALRIICKAPYGIMLYFPHHEGRGIGLYKKLQAYARQDSGVDTVDANIEVGEPVDARDYTLAARILKDLGAPVVRLLSNNPEKVRALSANGIRVADCVPVRSEPNKHNARYLATKRKRMAHDI